MRISKKLMTGWIESIRLHLYNRGLPCGPKAIIEHSKKESPEIELPSKSTISRILREKGLTYGRTGDYIG